jgi:hypothetical protein
MRKWESKFLPRSEEAIIIAVAPAATDTRAHASNKAKREGVSIMAIEAGIVTLPTRDLAKEGASGRTDLLPMLSKFEQNGFSVAYAELCFATTHTFAY